MGWKKAQRVRSNVKVMLTFFVFKGVVRHEFLHKGKQSLVLSQSTETSKRGKKKTSFVEKQLLVPP
jgi:hypothetical protein